MEGCSEIPPEAAFGVPGLLGAGLGLCASEVGVLRPQASSWVLGADCPSFCRALERGAGAEALRPVPVWSSRPLGTGSVTPEIKRWRVQRVRGERWDNIELGGAGVLPGGGLSAEGTV